MRQRASQLARPQRLVDVAVKRPERDSSVKSELRDVGRTATACGRRNLRGVCRSRCSCRSSPSRIRRLRGTRPRALRRADACGLLPRPVSLARGTRTESGVPRARAARMLGGPSGWRRGLRTAASSHLLARQRARGERPRRRPARATRSARAPGDVGDDARIHPSTEGGRPWPFHLAVTRGGQPLKASVTYEYVFAGQVVARRAHYSFDGHFSDDIIRPASAVGYPLSFRAAIVSERATIDLRLPGEGRTVSRSCARSRLPAHAAAPRLIAPAGLSARNTRADAAGPRSRRPRSGRALRASRHAR